MLEKIKNAAPEELDQILQAVLARYREVYPDWDMTVISLDRREDRDQQIRKIREFLDRLSIDN